MRGRRALIVVMIPVALSIVWMGFHPKRVKPTPPAAIASEAGWAPEHPSNRWECIVIHHSASNIGGAQRFDEWHRARGWDELGYHFVIGNGSDTGDGQVEVGPRWEAQKHGAHCKTPDEYYNQHGIGICLVGNFDNYEPSEAQIRSLVKLCRYLSVTFHIPPERIFTHGGITGKTDCPGKLLDVELIRRKISARSAI
jgi:N-acetyl-anhydromuramyl-L-alanine amidase AmpD